MRPTARNFEEWNEANAVKFDLDGFYNHPNRFFRYIENKRIQTLIGFSGIEDNHEVLDLGCGGGHILERIDRGILTGIDASETQIKRAKLRLRKDIILIRAAGEHIPFEDRHFDRIICSEVLEHVLEPEAILREIERVLKDDGIISLSIPNEKLIIFTKGILLKLGLKRVLKPAGSTWDMAVRNNLEEWHLHEYSLKAIRQQVSELFRIEDLLKIPSPAFPYRYVLKLRKRNNIKGN
jgi:2-polyprenyl-3-methyl-5-hydroxy-6-metoxy-1,4-benzoquinol methylase